MKSQTKLTDRLTSPYWLLRIAFGAVPFLAGLDKFFNLLTNWEHYLSPLAQNLLPLSSTTAMHLAGIIEMIVAIAILTRWTRPGSYIAAVWLVGIAINLLAAGFFDIAVRDLVMALAAYTLGRLSEARAEEAAPTVTVLRAASVA
jgi:uncharacterized membrane protein YphA (DoxX/SURF4 family)